ncbi:MULTISPECIES: hypothetical protein [Streptomyces]|uniref:Uncharacterized protein n=1 Tax=Streptomyces canarius TaxID=285453 RepID=A0ABQ3D5F4_9ACTN|nr:hypothetical protein [Streptomyces canarius]GHA51276.1 hypothetical protein GCM10010345_64660 [Streptomyces canarius]
MKPLDLAQLLAAPTDPPVRDALRRLAPRSLDALIIEALSATEEAWRQVAVDRVLEFVAEQPGDGRPVVAAYFTTTERRTADGMHVGWSPFVAALASTEDVPDLRHTRTTAVAVPVGEAALAEEVFADPELTDALNRLAALDPPGHEDVLRIHLPTRQVTRVKP